MVSVIIPVYNVEKYLRQCVVSLREIRTAMEIILVDDGSTDGSGILCDELGREDSRIRVIHQPNGGLSAARNTGIRNARGEYLLFLDSDDFLDPAATEALLKHTASGADALMGLYNNYYSDNDAREPENSPAFLAMEGLLPMERFLAGVPTDGKTCYMTAWRFLPRREFLVEQALYFLPGILHEDEEWTQRLLCRAGSVFVTHEYFYQYRQAREGAITSSVKPKAVWDMVTVLERTLEELDRWENCAWKREYLSVRAGQHYLDILLRAEVLDAPDRKRVLDFLEACRDRCAPYLRGSVGTLAKVFIGLLGIPAAGALLRSLRKIKKMMGR